LVQTNRLQDARTPAIVERIPGIANRQPRNVLFDYTQTIVSTSWLVTHNLNTNPVVQVAVDRPGTSQRLELDSDDFEVEIINSNTMRLNFSRPESGIAQFIARTTNRLQPTSTTIGEPDRIQISTNNVLTVATLIDHTVPTPPTAPVEITYVELGVEFPTAYTADAFPASVSPWNSADTIVVNGLEYEVRTIDLGDLPNTPGVSDNSSFYFSSPTEDMLILLSLPPFANADRITRQILDPTGIGADQAITSFVVAGFELFAVETIVEDVYPPVFIV
jgi:hypothetical protein